MKIIIQVVKHEGQVEVLPVLARDMYNLALGDDPLEKLNNAWERLQASVSSLVDSAYTYNVKMRMRGLKQVRVVNTIFGLKFVLIRVCFRLSRRKQV